MTSQPNSSNTVDSASPDDIAKKSLEIMASGRNVTLVFQTDDGHTETVALEAACLNDHGGYRYTLGVQAPRRELSGPCAAVIASILAHGNQLDIAQLIAKP